jgi:hypothetical protein
MFPCLKFNIMKPKLIFICVFIIGLSLSGFSQLKVNSSGTVGIGIDPVSTYNLRLNTAIFVTGSGYSDMIVSYDPAGYGRAIYPSINNYCRVGTPNNQFAAIYAQYHYSGTTYHFSDSRLKENLRVIEKPLEKLLQMNGVKYDFIKQSNDTISNEAEQQKLEKMQKDKLGFLAQDLEKIIPEAVLYEEDEDRYYIEYNALIPVIVEAMKEQQAQIEELKSELAGCCQEGLKSGSINNTDELNLNVAQAKLYQNNPNPFSVQTAVKFEIPETVKSAQLHICNMTGTLLKTITVNQRNNGSVIINANEFNAGMYLYSLVCDGKIVDTKQMLLTE